MANAVPHRGEVAGLQRVQGPVVVHVEAGDRVAEIVGQVARLGVPPPAELEGLRHRDRLVAEPDRVDQRGAVAGAPGDAHGLLRHRQALVDVGVPGALDAQEGDQAGAVGAVRIAEAHERAPAHLDAVTVDRAHDAVPASVVPQRGAHEDVDRADVVGQATGREQRLAVRGITRLRLGVAEPEEQHGPAPRVVGRGPVQEIERIPVPAQRLVGREQRQRPIARPLRVRDRLARVRRLGRLRPVERELSDPVAGIVAADRFERLRHRPMGAGPPAGREIVVERVLDQRVRERVAARHGRSGEHRCVDGLVTEPDDARLRRAR